MDGLHLQGYRLPLLSGITFDGAPFQIALSSDDASDVGGSAGIYKGNLTYLPSSPDSQPVVVAVKIFNMVGNRERQSQQQLLLVGELRAARIVSTRHPFILPFLGTAHDRHQEAIVSLYMRNGNLLEYFKANPNCDKKRLILQVADAVNYLHTARGLVHGDLKCANILVSDDKDALLADFGLSTFAEKSQIVKSTVTGIRQMNTVHFAAPELLANGDPSIKPPSKTRESDVYAFGMLVLEAMTESSPWAGVNDMAVMLHVCAGKRPPRPTSGKFVTTSHALWEACSSCWRHAPQDRPSMQVLLELLKDANFEPCLELAGHTDFVNSVAYLPGGRRVVTGSSDCSIRVWDTLTGRTVIGPLRGHYEYVYSVAVSPDGRQICSGGRDCTIRRWDAESGAPIGKPMTGHDNDVDCVAFSPDGARIVSGSDDTTVRLWDAATGESLGGRLTGHRKWVLSVAFSPDGACIASGSWDGTIRLWDGTTGAGLGVLHNSKTWARSVCFCPDRIHLVSGCSDAVIRIWNISTRQLARNIEAHSKLITSVAVSPSGRYIASGSCDKSICIWDAQTGDPVGAPLNGHTDDICSVAFSPDGRSLVSGSLDRTVRIWDLFE